MKARTLKRRWGRWRRVERTAWRRRLTWGERQGGRVFDLILAVPEHVYARARHRPGGIGRTGFRPYLCDP